MNHTDHAVLNGGFLEPTTRGELRRLVEKAAEPSEGALSRETAAARRWLLDLTPKYVTVLAEMQLVPGLVRGEVMRWAGAGWSRAGMARVLDAIEPERAA